MVFNGALWEERSNGKAVATLTLLALMTAAFISIPFSIHFFGAQSVAFFISVVSALCLLVAMIIVARVCRWNNGRNVFAFDHNGIYFTQVAKNVTTYNSYFSDEYSNIAGYRVDGTFDGGLTTVTVFFKKPSRAGVFGRLKSMTLVKVKNFDGLKTLLDEHGVAELPNEKAKK